jgi:hypothetical protein
MKLQTQAKRNAREISLLATARAYEALAKQEPQIKLIWFVTDEKGKLIPTGNSSKMLFRSTQCGFRKYLRTRDREKYTVHSIDIYSGMKFSIQLSKALKQSSESLRNLTVENIISLR